MCHVLMNDMGSARSSKRHHAHRGRGLPTRLPAAAESAPRQLALTIGGEKSVHQLLPGVVHIASWLDLDTQRRLAADFRDWAAPPAGLRHPSMPTGHLMSVQSVCLGWHWQPYAYSRTADDTDGAPVKPLPPAIAELARAAVDAAYGAGTAAAIRFQPACVFRMASVERRTGPFVDVEFGSGDLIVFGGPNRRIFHGVPKILPDTGPGDLGLPPGRLSITIRETGLSGDASEHQPAKRSTTE
jgi:alkylated DNA repair protein (DNA oxidative demethylase)